MARIPDARRHLQLSSERNQTMISSTAEYALRAIVHLATDADNEPRTSQQIADRTRAPAGYISKVLQDLTRAGIVHSRRGPNGGFTLARSPDAISILDVMNAVDPIRRIRSCPLGLPEHGTKLCALHQRLDDALAHIEDLFASSRISDMLKPSRLHSRCIFPTVERQAATGPAPRHKSPAGRPARRKK